MKKLASGPMNDTKLRLMAAWIRASLGDGMDDTALCRVGQIKEPAGGGMDNALVGWQHR